MNPWLCAGENGGSELGDEQRTLSQAIELFVHIHSPTTQKYHMDRSLRRFHDSSLHNSGHGAGKDVTPGMLCIYHLYSSTIELAYSVLQALNLDHCKEQLVSC